MALSCHAQRRLAHPSAHIHSTTMSTTAEAAAQLIYPANVQANSSLTTVKFISSCFAGAAAGILGLENWLGFVLFLSSTLFTSLCIHSINCRGNPSKFIQGGLSELANPGQDNAFTFVLVWTLFYGMSLVSLPSTEPTYRLLQVSYTVRVFDNCMRL